MDLYIIAGPNGVGKTTFAREFLPNYADCKNFVNADLIAQAMAPFSPETAAVRAGRMMLGEIRSFAKKRVSFAFETTLSGRGYMALLRQLKTKGYEIHIFFCGSIQSIWRYREFRSGFRGAGTMCRNRWFAGDLIGRCETS
jgi:predicted ABC-type ATPase